MDTQTIIVSIIVVAALFYVVHALSKSAKGNSCGSGKCGCDKPMAKNKSV